ncbi:MAG: flagellar assembly protein FliH [Thiohalomonadaceae bacterium]
MNTSKLISKEKLTAYERWELPNVGTEQARVTDEEVDAAALREMLSAEKLEEIRNQAHAEGFEQGRSEGLKAGQKEIAAQVQRLHQVLNALAEPLRDVNARVEQELVQLALALARQVVRRELSIDPAQVVALAREAINALPSHAERVQIFLHPDDAALMREHAAGTDNAWRIVDDLSLTRGGCRVVSENSRVDATLESRLAAVVERLMDGADEGPR